MSKVQTVTVKETGEVLEVYWVSSGGYYDWKGISEAAPPTAKKANKKRFQKDELIFN